MCEAKPECRFSNFYKIFILVSSASSVYDMSWDGRKYIDSRGTRYLLRCVPCGLRHLHCWLRCHGYERAPYASFTRYADDIYVNLTLMARIVVGDIGFLVWDDISQNNGTLGGTGCTAGGIKTTPARCSAALPFGHTAAGRLGDIRQTHRGGISEARDLDPLSQPFACFDRRAADLRCTAGVSAYRCTLRSDFRNWHGGANIASGITRDMGVLAQVVLNFLAAGSEALRSQLRFLKSAGAPWRYGLVCQRFG